MANDNQARVPTYTNYELDSESISKLKTYLQGRRWWVNGSRTTSSYIEKLYTLLILNT